MVEKRYISRFMFPILGFFLLWMGIFIVLIFYHAWQSKTISPIIQSWILIATRGYSGDPNKLDGLGAPAEYRYELEGDTHYRYGDIEGAIRAYSNALDIRNTSILSLKLALLSVEKEEGKTKEASLSGSLKAGLDESRARIEKDNENRGRYFGNSDTIRNQDPLFEVRDREIIDW